MPLFLTAFEPEWESAKGRWIFARGVGFTRQTHSGNQPRVPIFTAADRATDIGLPNAREGSRPDSCPCVIQLSRNHMDNESAADNVGVPCH
jgi:hypothetical protein